MTRENFEDLFGESIEDMGLEDTFESYEDEDGNIYDENYEPETYIGSPV
jgi:hypothetical protein